MKVLGIKIFFLAGNVSANIRNLLDGKALKKYKAGNPAMFVPLGRNGGVGKKKKNKKPRSVYYAYMEEYESECSQINLVVACSMPTAYLVYTWI